MEPLIRHGNEMKSSEIDTPRPREGREREMDSEATSFIIISSDFAKARQFHNSSFEFRVIFYVGRDTIFTCLFTEIDWIRLCLF